MPRYTKPYSDFKERLVEVDILRRLASNEEKKNEIVMGEKTKALTRGSIVLLCSHLEAYIKELGEVALDSLYENQVSRSKFSVESKRIYYYISKDIVDNLQDTSNTDKIVEKIFSLLNRDQKFWSEEGPFPETIPVDRFNQGFASPSFKKINKYFKRFGYTRYEGDLGSLLLGDFNSTVNAVNHLVNTRNKIAHGDPDTYAYMTPLELGDMIKTTTRFCRSTDDVFASWWKNRFCTIRSV